MCYEDEDDDEEEDEEDVLLLWKTCDNRKPSFWNSTFAPNRMRAKFRFRHSEVYSSVRSFSWMYQCVRNSETAFSLSRSVAVSGRLASAVSFAA